MASEISVKAEEGGGGNLEFLGERRRKCGCVMSWSIDASSGRRRVGRRKMRTLLAVLWGIANIKNATRIEGT